MLVLTRREGEEILLGDSIVVTVIRIAGDKVRLGIRAPSDVRVLRNELLSKQTEQAAADHGALKNRTPAIGAPVGLALARAAS